MTDISIDDVPSCVVISKTDFEIVKTNRKWNDLFGLNNSGKKPDNLLQILSKPSHIFLQTHVFPILLKEGHVDEVYLSLIDINKNDTPVLLNATRVEKENQTLIIWSFFVTKGRRKLEEELIQRKLKSDETALELKKISVELERSNKAMSSFAETVTHDLKAPLRHISITSDILLSLKPVGSDGQSTKVLNLLKTAVRRIVTLVDDLHEYSKAGKNHGDFQYLDMGDFIQNIFDLHAVSEQFDIGYRGNKLIFETLHVPLSLILRNLIGNAIKHHDRNDGTIYVKCREEDQFYHFDVIDDGPGIDEKYHELVFKELQRLTTINENSGSGLGLSMVKKTVKAYGGELELKSVPGEGATFSFTWPKKEKLTEIIG